MRELDLHLPGLSLLCLLHDCFCSAVVVSMSVVHEVLNSTPGSDQKVLMGLFI